MSTGFPTYHPIINFGYFCLVIGIGVFMMHPVFLTIGIIGSLIYALILNAKGTLKFTCLFLIPMTAIITIINPLVNPRGSTVLFYTANSQITLEATLYGLATGIMLSTIMLWFACYNRIITRDKFIYIFGRIMPSLSLIFTMVMGFIPRFKKQIKLIYDGQRCVGVYSTRGGLKDKIKQGGSILSTMMTWELENSIDTSDSMRARGYGIRGRTSFSNYRLIIRDVVVAVAILMAAGIVICGSISGRCSISYYPDITVHSVDIPSIITAGAYGVLCMLPSTIELKEVIAWKYLESKI